MIYAYRCRKCLRYYERDVPMEARNEQTCVCGERLRRAYRVAVHIPVHMRAAGDDVIRQIMPQDVDGGPEARKAWLRAAYEQGIDKRYHHDREG